MMQMTDHNETASLVKVDIAKNLEARALAFCWLNLELSMLFRTSRIKAFTAPVDAAALKDQWAIAKVSNT